MSELPTPAPAYTPEAAPYWDGLAEGRLVLPVCDACSHHIWYPRSWCSVCGSESVTWTEVSGRGEVYAFTVVRRAMGPWKDALPFVAGYVELAEGPRVLANIVTDDPESVSIGTPVQATFVPVTEPRDGEPTTLLRFTTSVDA